jgi:hypothetical protein
MLETSDDFWCPLGDTRPPGAAGDQDLSADDWEALTRLDGAEWVSDAQIAALESLGLVEKAFGHALLTRLGRAALARRGTGIE